MHALQAVAGVASKVQGNANTIAKVAKAVADVETKVTRAVYTKEQTDKLVDAAVAAVAKALGSAV